MPRRAAAALLPFWFVLALGLRLLHFGQMPIHQEAAAVARLSMALERQGWHRLDDQPLLADGSLTARRHGRGPCVLASLVLPSDPSLAALVQSNWGPAAVFLTEAGTRVLPTAPLDRLAAPWQALRQRLGGSPAPGFTLAFLGEGPSLPCAGLDLRGIFD